MILFSKKIIKEIKGKQNVQKLMKIFHSIAILQSFKAR